MISLFVLLSLVSIPPADLHIEAGQTQIIPMGDSETLILDELILEENSALELPKFKSIHIRNLVVKDGARIRFPVQISGSDGPSGGQGADGTNARFFIQKLDGHLVIESLGGDGGDGRHGRFGRQGKVGEKGADGRKLFKGFIWVSRGRPGNDGAPGEDGEDGEDGGQGGSGGHIRVYFVEKLSFAEVHLDVSGGKGGAGGQGGLGGLGGNGGPGGRGTRPGKQGRMGARGKHGLPGRPGIPGKPGTASLYQVDQNLFECLVQLDLIKDLEPQEVKACQSLSSSLPS